MPDYGQSPGVRPASTSASMPEFCVPARLDHGHLFALHLFCLLEQAGESEGAGGLGEIVRGRNKTRIASAAASSLTVITLAAPAQTTEIASSSGSGRRHRRRRFGGLSRDDVPGCHRKCRRGRLVRHHPYYLGVKPEKVTNSDEPAYARTLPDRNIDGIELAGGREELAGISRDAENEISVETRHGLEPAFRRGPRELPRLLEVTAMNDQLRPKGLHGAFLSGLLPCGTTIATLRPFAAPGKSKALAVIAPGRRDDPFDAGTLLAQPFCVNQPSTDLERSRWRVVLVLYPDFGAHQLRQQRPEVLRRRGHERAHDARRPNKVFGTDRHGTCLPARSPATLRAVLSSAAVYGLSPAGLERTRALRDLFEVICEPPRTATAHTLEPARKILAATCDIIA